MNNKYLSWIRKYKIATLFLPLGHISFSLPLALESMIRLQCIYHFYCSMLLYYHSWMLYNHFTVILYNFLVLTYWHSAQWQLLFYTCFLHRRKSIPNGVQTQRNFLWIFWTRRHPLGQRSTKEGARGEHKTPGRARRPRSAFVGCAHLGGLPHRLFAL